MKRVFCALVAGTVLSWLLYIVAYHGTGGLILLVAIFELPVRILASVITKDRETGEIIYWSLLTCLNSFIVYSVIWVAAVVKRRKNPVNNSAAEAIGSQVNASENSNHKN